LELLGDIVEQKAASGARPLDLSMLVDDGGLLLSSSNKLLLLLLILSMIIIRGGAGIDL